MGPGVRESGGVISSSLMRPRKWLMAVMAECAGGGHSKDSGHYLARGRFPLHVLDIARRLLTTARAGATGIDGGDDVQWR